MALWRRTAWVQSLALPFLVCGMVGLLLTLSILSSEGKLEGGQRGLNEAV